MADPLIDRFRAAFRALLAEMMPDIVTRYAMLGFHRYSVVSCDYDAQTFDAQPSVSKTGLPAISKIPIRSPLKIDLKGGASVLIGFEGGDPTAPFLAFADQLTLMSKAKLRADGSIEIGENASQPAARQGDMVLIPSLGCNIMFAALPTGDPIPTPMM